METVNRTAFDPNTERKYEIQLPADSVVLEALFKLDFPPEGLSREDIVDRISLQLSLTDEQKDAKYSNATRIFNNNVGKVISNQVKLNKLVELDTYFICYPEQLDSVNEETENNINDYGKSFEESIETNFNQLRKNLAEALLQKIKDNQPGFFEELVIDLLVAMGYGGSREDAGKAVGRSHDGGIDGIINEDRLGLDVVYVQAKRWEANIGEPPIRDFVGALDGEGAQKGIFITTSNFSSAAERFAERSTKKVVLIDGQQLTEYMIDHNIGVATSKIYELKRVDSDYFAEEK